MKTCTRCKQEKPLSEYRMMVTGVLNSWCHSCHLADNRARRERYKQRGEVACRRTDPLNVALAQWIRTDARALKQG